MMLTILKVPLMLRDYQGDFLSEAEQYESLIRLSDESLKYLIDYFSKSSEKTLICFFGDHQPALDDDFMDYAYGKPRISCPLMSSS